MLKTEKYVLDKQKPKETLHKDMNIRQGVTLENTNNYNHGRYTIIKIRIRCKISCIYII